MHELVTEIREKLVASASAEIRAHSDHFFKKDEEIDPYGVKNADIKAIAREAAKRLANAGKADVLSICDELWPGKYEEKIIACDLAYAEITCSTGLNTIAFTSPKRRILAQKGAQ